MKGRPSVLGLVALIAFEAAAPQPVAAFEVADSSLRAGAVASHPPAGAPGALFLGAGDVHPVGVQGCERVVARRRHEPTVQRDLSHRQRQVLELGDGVRQQRVLGRVARRGRRRQDEPARARLGVLCHLAQLVDVPELCRLAELALADRPRVGIPQ